jgi:hypothetical protein
MMSKNEMIPGGADEHAGEFRNFGFHERRVAPCAASVNKGSGKSLGRHAFGGTLLVFAWMEVVWGQKSASRKCDSAER